MRRRPAAGDRESRTGRSLAQSQRKDLDRDEAASALAGPPAPRDMVRPWTRGPTSISRCTIRSDDAHALAEAITIKRDRLLASLTLIGGRRADPRLAVRAARRRRILPSGDRGAGHRDRAGADARMVRAARRAVEARRGAVRRHLPADRDLRDRLDRASGDRLGGAGPGADRPRSATRSSRCSTSTRRRTLHRPHRVADRRSTPAERADGPDRDAQFDARACSPPRRRTPLIQLFFALLVIFFFLAGWTGDAQADDRQPRQLRRRADHRAGDPAGGRRDLDLSRHDHRHQRHAGRADRADPVAARHGLAADVGRHRRGAQLHPLSRARSPSALLLVLRRPDDLSRSPGRRCCRRRSSSGCIWSRPISSRR